MCADVINGRRKRRAVERAHDDGRRLQLADGGQIGYGDLDFHAVFQRLFPHERNAVAADVDERRVLRLVLAAVEIRQGHLHGKRHGHAHEIALLLALDLRRKLHVPDMIGQGAARAKHRRKAICAFFARHGTVKTCAGLRAVRIFGIRQAHLDDQTVCRHLLENSYTRLLSALLQKIDLLLQHEHFFGRKAFCRHTLRRHISSSSCHHFRKLTSSTRLPSGRKHEKCRRSADASNVI